MSVGERERERERERESARERKIEREILREGKSVCESERECVCVGDRERESVRERESARVCQSQRECVGRGGRGSVRPAHAETLEIHSHVRIAQQVTNLDFHFRATRSKLETL